MNAVAADGPEAELRAKLRVLADTAPDEAFGRALSLVSDADARVRVVAVNCLSELHRDPGSEIVARLLDDPEALVRVAALELVVAGAAPASGKLDALLASDSSEVVRAYTAWALSRVGGIGARVVLRARLRVEQSEVVRAGIIEALYCLTRHAPYLDMLLASLSSSDPEARAFTSNSLVGVLSRENAARVIESLREAASRESFPAIALVLRDNLESAESMRDDDDFEME